MARLCERPGCSQPAEVTYGIDADHLTVWIEPLGGAADYRAGVLCRRHADAMVVPLGWMLDDRREAVPRLFRPRDTATPVKQRAKRQRHHSATGDDTGQLELGVVPHDEADDAVPAAVASEFERPETPWKPVFDQRDDLDGLLTARSPLLSRAFGKRDQPK
jgi:hypothetical protein